MAPGKSTRLRQLLELIELLTIFQKTHDWYAQLADASKNANPQLSSLRLYFFDVEVVHAYFVFFMLLELTIQSELFLELRMMLRFQPVKETK